MNSDVIGKTIAGCKVTEMIGKGGMGLVYKAHHLVLDQDRALKVMDPYIARDELFMKRFHAEARSLARVHSPYIVAVHDLCETEIGTCLIMEYVNGQTFSEVIKNSSGPLDLDRVFHIFKQVLLAIEHAHGAGVIHRDLKPGNILLTKNDEVKVTDFGLAKIQEHGSATVTQLTGGTIYYMPPEQLAGLGNVDQRGDLYSLGMTLYEVLTGSVPFEKTESDFGIREKIVKGKIPPPKTYNSKIPESLNALVVKSIAKDPARRFQTAAEMRIALEKIEAEYHHQKSKPSKASSGTGIGKWIAAAVFVVLAGGIAIYYYSSRSTTEHTVGSPATAQLSIQTTPANAIVELGGKLVGQTPVSLTREVFGRIDLKILKENYEPKDTSVVLNKGDSLFLDFMLKPTAPAIVQEQPKPVAPVQQEPALLYVTTSPPRSDVYIDGKWQKGMPPFTLEPGPRTIRVVAGDHKWEKQINARPRAIERLAIDFTKKLRLTIIANEADASGGPDSSRPILGCRIFVDGVEVASSTPKLINLNLGYHTIKVTHPEYGESQPVAKTFDQDGRLRLVLGRPASGPASIQVSTTPSGASVYIDGVQQSGASPYRVSPGNRFVKVVSGDNIWEKRIQVSPGRTEHVVVDFSKVLAITVIVNEPDASGRPDSTKSIPGCSVFLDGVEVASGTPRVIKFNTGYHTVKVSHPMYGEAAPISRTFEEDGKLRFVLKKR